MRPSQQQTSFTAIGQEQGSSGQAPDDMLLKVSSSSQHVRHQNSQARRYKMALDIRSFWESVKRNRYAHYCLLLMMLTYLVNQLHTFSLVATNISMANEIKYGEKDCRVSNNSALLDFIESAGLNLTASQYCSLHANECQNGSSSYCAWYYTGTGLEYQLLAGPFYIVMYGISAVPLGLATELQNLSRKWVLVACALLWSAMTVLGGLATAYWHIAITRILTGVFSAACVPFSVSMIADLYTPEQKGAAIGFFNWGIFIGYSFTFLLLIAERNLGWRAVYFIAGAPGIALGLLVLVTMREPKREASDSKQQTALTLLRGTCSKLKTAAYHFINPALILLCLGGGIRNGAGLVWAYNIVIFFDQYHPGTQTEEWMSWIPLIFGSLGAFGGGYLSDKLAATKGIKGRLIILIMSLVFSAPFQVGLLYLPMPWAFISNIPAYLIGEIWLGVSVAVVVDLVPSDLKTSAVAVYFFAITIIGGNMNLLIPPLTEHLSLQLSLLVMFPGSYVAGALFFCLALVVIMFCNNETTDKGFEASLDFNGADNNSDRQTIKTKL